MAEAALISKAIGGAAVKVVWTREDDIHHDSTVRVLVERLEGGVDSSGNPSLGAQQEAPAISSLFKSDPKHQFSSEAAMGLVDMPFQIENVSIENGEAEAHAKIGWFRSISNISHAFAIQSFVGELAIATGKDHRCDSSSNSWALLELSIWEPDSWDPWDSSDAYLGRHGSLTGRRGARHQGGRMGAQIATRTWSWPRRPSQLRQLRRRCYRGRG